MAQKIGLSTVNYIGPHLVFFFNGEIYHWSGGWHESQAVSVLAWMNKIAHPLIEMHDFNECEAFQVIDTEWHENTDFINASMPLPLNE